MRPPSAGAKSISILRMSALGHKRTSRRPQAMSALLPKADINRRERHVRFVPKADVCTAAKRRPAYRHCGAKLNTDDCRYAGCGTDASSLRYAWQEALRAH